MAAWLDRLIERSMQRHRAGRAEPDISGSSDTRR